jgi:hypothetical protein
MSNVFDIFKGTEQHTVKIKALGDKEITYRDLTMQESDAFTSKLVTGYDEKGKPKLNYEALNQLKYDKLSLVLVDPKMTVKDLEILSAHALSAINEILELVDGRDDEEEDKDNEKKAKSPKK